jgi:hypothetical protein
MSALLQRSQRAQHPNFPAAEHLNAVDKKNAHGFSPVAGCSSLVAGHSLLVAGARH